MIKKIFFLLISLIVFSTQIIADYRQSIPLQSTLVRDLNRFKLKDFIIVKQVNQGLANVFGASDATYVPEVDWILYCGNNATMGCTIYQAGDISTQLGFFTLTGFTDPEELVYLRTIYDSNGQPDSAVFAVFEEQVNTFHIFTWDLQALSGAVAKASTISYTPTGMFAPSGTLGMEGGVYLPDTNQLLVFKQSTNMEARLIPLDQGLTPAATTPFNAQTLFTTGGVNMPAINGCDYDINSKTCLCVGDATGATDGNGDIVNFDCYTGAVIQYMNNIYVDLALPTTTLNVDFVQTEGIAISPDGENLFLVSEGNEAVVLQRNKGNWSRNINTAVGNVGAGEDVLITTPIPSGILKNNGDAIRFTARGTFAANANSKRVECDYGATPVMFIDSGAQIQNGGAWAITGTITRTGAATQDIGSTFSGPPVLFPTTPAFVTDNETLANAITFECHAEGVADNDIVQESLLLEYLQGGIN